MHHPLPGAGESLLWGGHSRSRLYSAGGRALLVFLLLTWVPPGAGVHPPALRQPVIPVCCGDTTPRPFSGVPDWREGLLSLGIGRPLRASLLGLTEACFSPYSRDRLWKLFLEARRAAEVSWSLL